jgi:hypothetical protein
MVFMKFIKIFEGNHISNYINAELISEIFVTKTMDGFSVWVKIKGKDSVRISQFFEEQKLAIGFLKNFIEELRVIS